MATKAVRSIGRVRTQRRRELLQKIARDTSRPARARGEALAVLGEFDGVPPTVLTSALSNDTNAKVRRGAAKGLIRMEEPKTIPELVNALNDPDERVRAYANTAIHNMIVRRFDFDPKRSPDEQQEVIERLKAYLTKCGVL